MKLLLLLLLLGGNVTSQTSNGTKEEPSNVESNRTSREFVTTTMKPGNWTSSLFGDETRLFEEELRNQTIITEDDERFQDPDDELPGRRCREDDLERISEAYCLETFHSEMLSVSPESRCELENIIRPYNECTVCLEMVSNLLDCFYPNPVVQGLFLSLHFEYFINCSAAAGSEAELVDAPRRLVLALTLVPVGIVPVLVYLVVWKSGVKE